jgi:hypothetical protein
MREWKHVDLDVRIGPMSATARVTTTMADETRHRHPAMFIACDHPEKLRATIEEAVAGALDVAGIR